VKWPHPRHISSSRAYSDKIPTATPMFSGSNFLVVVLPVSWDVGVLEIQDGSQPTGSSNISETMTHSIKIPTVTTIFSGSAFLLVALPASWDVDAC